MYKRRKLIDDSEHIYSSQKNKIYLVTFHQMILSYTQLGVLEEIEFRHQLPDDI